MSNPQVQADSILNRLIKNIDLHRMPQTGPWITVMTQMESEVSSHEYLKPEL